MDPDVDIRFTAAAQAELEAAARWYGQRSERALRTFLDAIDYAVALLQKFPEAWPTTTGVNVRRLKIHRTPYALIYRYEPPNVIVLAVAHGSRRPEYWWDREA